MVRRLTLIAIIALLALAGVALWRFQPGATICANGANGVESRRVVESGPAREGASPAPSVAGTPVRKPVPIPASAAVLSFRAPDHAVLLAKAERLADERGIYRFAERLAADVTPAEAGAWERLAGGWLRWSLRVASPGAANLNFGFSEFSLPNGARLSVSEPGADPQFREFTAADNAGHGQLWTPLLAGDEALIQLTIHEAQRAQMRLRLAAVNHGFRGWKSPAKADKIGGGSSGSCNIDVACSAADGAFGALADAYRDQIQAVGAYTLEGIDKCSGALINNTAGDRRPFFLTADHCGIGPGNAPSMVVYWNFQNSTCRQPGSAASGSAGDGGLTQFNSGAIFRAGYSESDFTLVELDEPALPEANPFFAGWDRSGANATMAAAIHHPDVAEKRISFELDPTTVTFYNANAAQAGGDHIRVADWDFGTTESGSSGSPLFDQDGRIIGQLHGGDAACGNDLPDWYGRLATSWGGGGTPTSQLSAWLDPLGSGATAIGGTFQDEILSVQGAAVAEGDSGQATITFTITLRPAAPDAVTVTAQTADGTAAAGSDYIALEPTALTFLPGETVKTLEVVVLGDTAPEGHEEFQLVLSDPVNADVAGLPGIGTILNDDFIPPEITSDAAVDALRLVPFSYQIAALNTPTGFAIEGAPAGMAVDPLTGRVTWVPPDAGAASFTAVAINPAGEDRLLVSIAIDPNTLFDAVELSESDGLTSNAPAWARQLAVSYDGTDAARSAFIGGNGRSTMSLQLTGPDAVVFWWRVSSEQGYDFLRLLRDSEVQAEISGHRDWARQTLIIPEGQHTVAWVYEKDGSASEGADAGWVDQVSLASQRPGPTIISPLVRRIQQGVAFSYEAEVFNGPAAISFAGLPDGLSDAGGGSIGGIPVSVGSAPVTMTAATEGGTDVETLQISVFPAVGPAVEQPELPFEFAGEEVWAEQSAVVWEGASAARSGAIGDGQTSELVLEVDGPDTIVFWWKVSSELGYDFLRFEADGFEQFAISGEVGWERRVYQIPGGTHRLRWIYGKDSSNFAGADAGYLDLVSLGSTSATPVITSSQSAEGYEARAFAYQTTVFGQVQGYAASGLPAGLAIDPATGLIAGVPQQAGTFNATLTASGPGGSDTSPLEIVLIDLLPLNDAVGSPGSMPFYGSGTTWSNQSAVSHDGVDAAASALIGDGASSRLDSFVTGPGALNFWWQVSSEEGYDFLRFLVDGGEVKAMSGSSGWVQESIALSPGEHRVSWIYEKDGSAAAGADRGYLDEVSLSGYAGWVATSGVDPAAAGLFDDADRDGVPNLAEFALGLDPTLPDAHRLPAPAEEAGYLTLAVSRAGADPSVRFAIEGSPSPAGPWSAANATVLQDDAAILKARYAQPIGAGAEAGYLRVRIWVE